LGRLDAADQTLAGGASRLEDIEVHQPGAAVELAVDGLDEPWLGAARLVWNGLDDDVAGHWLWVLGRAPADDDGVASVPEVELLEWAWQ
jgi:hypothetical protein